MIWAAFFRGINVGGKNIVRMAELRAMLMSLGFGSAKTLLQSGNAVFEADGGEADIARLIVRGFEETFGFLCNVMLRSGEELCEILANAPYTAEEIEEARVAAEGAACHYCYLFERPLTDVESATLQAAELYGDRVLVSGREAYLLCRQSIRFSKAAAALEKLKIPTTARNMDTLTRISVLISGNSGS